MPKDEVGTARNSERRDSNDEESRALLSNSSFHDDHHDSTGDSEDDLVGLPRVTDEEYQHEAPQSQTRKSSRPHIPRQSSIYRPAPDGQRRTPRTPHRVRFDLSEHVADEETPAANGHVQEHQDGDDLWIDEEDYMTDGSQSLRSSTGQMAPLLTGIEAPSVTLATSDEFFPEDHLESARPRSGMRMAFMNMANSIIGAGIIGQPYAFKQAGMVTGIVLLVVLTITVDWTIRLIVINSKMSGADSFQATMQHCFGRSGLIAISIAQWAFAFGGMIAFCIIVGDTIPHVFAALFPSLRDMPFLWLLTDRRAVIVLFILCISYPLSLYRDIAKLAKASALALVSMLVIVVTVVIQGFRVPSELRGDLKGNLFINSGFFQAVGVISFAFVCHHNSLLIYGSLKKPTLDRFTTVTHYSTGVSMVMCLVMALAGFLSFGSKTQGNVLNNFPSNNIMVNIARLCFGLNMLTTLPLEAFVCRSVMTTYYFPDEPFHPTRHLYFTTVLVLTSMFLSLVTCDLGAVFELIGATSAAALAYILPPLCYVKLSNTSHRAKLPAYACIVFGTVVMVISLFQADDLGLDRRIEITTADDKRDPYARFTEKDLQALRKSVQDPQPAQLQDRDKKHLDAWSNFHQKVEMEEGVFTDEPQLMNGQSHRAHLHFDMRHKEGLVSKRVAPSRHVPAGRTHHLDPALDPGKFSFDIPNPPGPAPGITRPAFGKPTEGPRFDKHKGLKVQRRPIRAPHKPVINTAPQKYEVKLADPGSWLNTVRSKTDQPNASALPSTSQVETTSNTKSSTESQPVATKPVVANKPVATTQAPAVVKPVVKMLTNVTPKPTAATQPASITHTVATTSPVGFTKPVATQINVTTTPSVATTTAKPASAVQPVATPEPVPKLENPFFDSNLPQPQTNSSTPRAQPQPTKDADLLLNFDSPPKKKGPEPMKSASEPDMMELDEDGDKADSDTAVASVLKKRLVWLDELGVINDTLADPDLTDIKVIRQLKERRKKVQDMIHAASNQKVSKPQQMTPRPEKLIELSPTPLQKVVTAQSFVPPAKATFGKAKPPLKGGLQASRWADPDVEMTNTRKESPKKTFKPRDTSKRSNNNVDYWQKTLPKLRPLPPDLKRTIQPPAPTPSAPQKPTNPLFESRYAS